MNGVGGVLALITENETVEVDHSPSGSETFSTTVCWPNMNFLENSQPKQRATANFILQTFIDSGKTAGPLLLGALLLFTGDLMVIFYLSAIFSVVIAIGILMLSRYVPNP